MGQHAVGAPAVGDHLGPFGQLGDAVGELVDGDGHGARDVTGRVLLGRAYVQDDDLAGRGAGEQFLAVDGSGVVGSEVGGAGRGGRLLPGRLLRPGP